MLTEAGYCPVPGAQIYYEVSGDPAGPALLLIHAGVADHTMWEPQVAHFKPRYRVIRYDTRGFGRSETEDVSFSNRADAVAVLDHLGIDRAVVVGCSRGGQIAVETALEFPERVRALVPVAAGLSGYPYQPDGSEREKLEFAWSEKMEAAWAAKDWEALADLDVRYWADGPGQPEGRAKPQVREAMRRMCLNNYRSHSVSGQAMPLDPPAYARLADIRVPTLVMAGDLDETITIKMGVVMGERIPGARYVVLEGTAHVPSMEQPEAFNRILEDFLSRV